MKLPCICLSCKSVLLTYGNTRHSCGLAVACDNEAARQERKAKKIYGMGWIVDCTECNYYEDARSEILTFDRVQLAKVISGIKTATTRDRIHGTVGDIFWAAGEQYKITAIYPITPDTNIHDLMQKEGYASTHEYVHDICEVYYTPDVDHLYVHEFAKVA